MRVIVWLLLFFAFSVQANEDAVMRQFNEANELYRAEKYQEAIAKYEYIASHFKMHSAELYFNLANAHYKLNHIAPAVLNYEKARLLNPGDPEIAINLGYVHKMMIDEVNEVPAAGFLEMIGQITQTLPTDGWAFLSILLALGVFGLFCGYYLSAVSRAKKWYFASMLAVLILFAVSVLFGFYEMTRQKKHRPAIVFDGIASVRAEPKEKADSVSTLHEGTKVYILEELDNWRHVRLPNGNDGWINENAVQEVKLK